MFTKKETIEKYESFLMFLKLFFFNYKFVLDGLILLNFVLLSGDKESSSLLLSKYGRW